jgi:hypothetical protein
MAEGGDRLIQSGSPHQVVFKDQNAHYCFMMRCMKKLSGTIATFVLATLACLTLVAILFPVYAYSGPGIGFGRIEQCILNLQQRTGRWPSSTTDIQSCMTRLPPMTAYWLTRESVDHDSKGATYTLKVRMDFSLKSSKRHLTARSR